MDWFNQTVRDYEGPIEQANVLFEESQKRWDASATCKEFTSQIHQLLDGEASGRTVTKIVCFGLGDLNLKPPDWWRIQNNSQAEDERLPETYTIEAALIQHAMALTLAKIAQSYVKPKDSSIRLLTQDPAYSNETKEMLQGMGFEVTGDYGAGGFAEIDDETIVFSVFTKAPVKQIIADLARPVAIICPRSTSDAVFNKHSYVIHLLPPQI